MNKKTALGILGAGLVIPTAFGLAGCSHDHKASAEWTMDSSNHWHVCSEKDCNEKVGVAKHTAKYVTVTKATSSKHGLALKSCGDCGYELSNEFTTVHVPKITRVQTTEGGSKFQISCADSSCTKYYVDEQQASTGGSGDTTNAVTAQDMKKLDDNYIGTSAIKVPYTNLGNDIISFQDSNTEYICKVASDKTVELYTIPEPDTDGKNGVTKYTYNSSVKLNVKGNYATVSGNTEDGLFNGLNGTVKCSIDQIDTTTKLLAVEYMGNYAYAKIGENNALTLITDAKDIFTGVTGTVYNCDELKSTITVYTKDGKSYATIEMTADSVQGGNSTPTSETTSKTVCSCKVSNGTLELMGCTFKITTTTTGGTTTNKLTSQKVEEKGTKKYSYEVSNENSTSTMSYHFNVVDGQNICYYTSKVTGTGSDGKTTTTTNTMVAGKWKELEDRIVLVTNTIELYFGYTLESGVVEQLA